jgi:hypothetical protein
MDHEVILSGLMVIVLALDSRFICSDSANDDKSE